MVCQARGFLTQPHQTKLIRQKNNLFLSHNRQLQNDVKFGFPFFLWVWSAYYLGFDLLALYYFLTGITTFQDFWVPEVFSKFFAGIVLAAIGIGVFVFQSRKKNIAKE